eukprot:72653_1
MNCKQHAVKRASLEFIASLEDTNTALFNQNALLKREVRHLKQQNYQLRDELMVYKFREVQTGRARSITAISMEVSPVKCDVIHGLHCHRKYIDKWHATHESFIIHKEALYQNDKHKVNHQHLFDESKRFELRLLKQSATIGAHVNTAMEELHSHLLHLKQEMECCEVNLKNNSDQQKEVITTLKQTQLKKVMLMQQYQDILDEFQAITQTESALMDKREDNERMHSSLCLKSDELMLISDQMIDCIHDYKHCQRRLDQEKE